MKALLSILTSASALLVDGFLTAVAITQLLTAETCLELIAARAIIAGLGALAVQINIPPIVRGSRGSYFFVSFLLVFFIPVVGIIGVQLVALLGLTAVKKDQGDPWEMLDLDEELYNEPTAMKRPVVSASKISALLQERAPEHAERRFQAILLVKHLPANQQVDVLKLALKDASDEVRLFAFSRIEKFRADLEGKIKTFTADLEKAEARDRPLLHLRLAESFHEIAYLKLAEGAVLDHALDQALQHALEAKRLQPTSGPAEYLLGRILLRKGDYDRAVQSFQAAVRLYYPRTKVIPYLAECAFRQKRYDAVRAMLGEMGRATRGASVLQPLVDFWR